MKPSLYSRLHVFQVVNASFAALVGVRQHSSAYQKSSSVAWIRLLLTYTTTPVAGSFGIFLLSRSSVRMRQASVLKVKWNLYCCIYMSWCRSTVESQHRCWKTLEHRKFWKTSPRCISRAGPVLKARFRAPSLHLEVVMCPFNILNILGCIQRWFATSLPGNRIRPKRESFHLTLTARNRLICAYLTLNRQLPLPVTYLLL